jgi:hypothetical protein
LTYQPWRAWSTTVRFDAGSTRFSEEPFFWHIPLEQPNASASARHFQVVCSSPPDELRPTYCERMLPTHRVGEGGYVYGQ